ncbi:alpha/beta fold hydrolase [Gracilibacillus sp. S3-1-1]|uniref:Alpha/beta fold hydrolase n=1 Tax=Gracilibacillus pellucidus TaxID=3095368 RepID=A0ACC6M5Q5_9BACI|nr:alpha/beta fold hydrolase [Gracilibacillus sp. S3-1-1]MDX8046318.1 alpha/beta fold hydrolase [Gracilibacillus sp. S3-1-1]
MTACLVIHGFTGGPYEVEPLATYIEEQTDWYVVTPKLPGHGLGAGRDLELSDVSYKDWISEAEQAYLNIAKAHADVYLIGFSMGGMIAAYLAAKYTCVKLVLLSTSRKYISVPRMGADILQFAQKAVRHKLHDDVLFNHYRKKYGSVPWKAIREFLRCMKFTKPYLKDIHCPVFIAQGMQDGMVPYKTVHYLDKEIPVDADIIYFHDSKHLICLGDDKEVVINAVFQFLTKESSPQEQTSVGG